MKFTFKSSAGSETDEHSLEVDNVKSNSATFIVRSEPQQFELNVNESMDLDLDTDSVNDMRVKLLSTNVTLNYAEINVSLLTAGKTVEIGINESAVEKSVIEVEEAQGLNKVLVSIVVVIVLVVIGLVLLLIFKKEGQANRRGKDIFKGRF